MNIKYKEVDVRNAIKSGLKNYTDLARVRVKSAWKNMSLNSGGNPLVFHQRNWNFCISLHTTATAFSLAISFSIKSGALITSATQEQLTFT